FDPGAARALETARIAAVADGRRNSRVEPAVAGRVEQRLKVRALAGDQDDDGRQLLGHAQRISTRPAASSTTSPIAQACSPSSPSRRSAASASSGATTAIMPMPQL